MKKKVGRSSDTQNNKENVQIHKYTHQFSSNKVNRKHLLKQNEQSDRAIQQRVRRKIILLSRGGEKVFVSYHRSNETREKKVLHKKFSVNYKVMLCARARPR